MGQWGKEFVFEEMLFMPHVSTGSNPFNPINGTATIDDIFLNDSKGDPEKGEAVLARLKATWVGKPYYDLWPALRRRAETPVEQAAAAHFAGIPDADKAGLMDEAATVTQKAREMELSVLRRLFPVGSPIRWKATPYVFTGIVDQHIAFEAALWAKDSRGSRVKVTAYAIREALADAG